MKKIILSLATIAMCAMSGFSQNLAINADGSTANANAILDVKSNNKGILIPRMSTAQRNAIPATQGMLVYDLTTNSFWYNTGAEWQNMAQSALGASGAWLTSGNSGLHPSNFLGTLEEIPLNIRVNNIASGTINPGNFNTFWGYGSGAANTFGLFNTGVGHEALHNNTEGYSNTAYGRFSMRVNTIGHSNTAIGMDALGANTIGNRNTTVGNLSMLNNISGKENVAMGYDVLRSNTTGNSNTAIGNVALHNNNNGNNNTVTGASALYANTSGDDNTANGYYAMHTGTGNFNTAMGSHAMWLAGSGNYNTAIGHLAMLYSQDGSHNTGVGHDALRFNSNGSWNTALGANAGTQSDNMTNTTAIGAGAEVDASNKVRIGNSAVTVIEGQVPFTTPSDGRYKFNVEEDVKGIDFIMQLRPVTYQFDVKRFDGNRNISMDEAYDEAEKMRRTGFIAQEVEKAAMSTGYNFSGVIKPKKDSDHYSLSYDAFVVPLVKAMQEQQQVINEQNKKISDLQQQLDEIKKLLQQKK